MKDAPHIPISRREFLRAKKRLLKLVLTQFVCPDHDAEVDDDLLTGAGYLPDDVYRDVHQAHQLLCSAYEKLKAHC